MVMKRSLSLKEECRLRVFESRILRRIFEPKRDENGEWSRLHNEELHSLYRSPNLITLTILGERYEVPHCGICSTPHSHPSWTQLFASGSCFQIFLVCLLPLNVRDHLSQPLPLTMYHINIGTAVFYRLKLIKTRR